MDHSFDRELDSSMSKFTFLHKEGDTEVSYSFHNIYCPEIVEHFKYFMQGCGFFDTNIMAAMSDLVHEYETMEEKKHGQSSLSS